MVLIHGLASNLAFWYSGIILPLRYRYRVTAYDLPGHGMSGMPHSGYTHKEMADDLLGLVQYLGLERFHLVGHSFGGLVSLSFAIRYPEYIRSLTLADVPIDGAHQSDCSFWWSTLLDKLRDLGVTIRDDDPQPEYQILEQLAYPEIRSIIQRQMPIFTHLPFGVGKGADRTAKRWLELLHTTTAREDIRSREFSVKDLRRVKLPTLAIYGTESKWRSSSEVLRDYLPECDIVYVEKAGHFHPREKPNIFLQHLWRFISSRDEPAQHLFDDRREV